VHRHRFEGAHGIRERNLDNLTAAKRRHVTA
jgi:hypothetical protein